MIDYTMYELAISALPAGEADGIGEELERESRRYSRRLEDEEEAKNR